MWYIIQAAPNARIIVGFKEKCDKATYIKHLENNTIVDLLDNKIVQQGDMFFLETGTVHAIGAGMVVAEIQQTSDITYRIYDFNRIDNQGNLRELHTKQALRAINFNKTKTQIDYSKQINQSNKAVSCPYFTTNFIPLDGSIMVKQNLETFKVYMCVDGAFELYCNGNAYFYKKGDSILIPAQIDDFELSGTASILEIYIL